MFIRSQIETLEGFLNEEQRFIQVIMDPRSEGKTTMINQLLLITTIFFTTSARTQMK